MLNPSFIMPIKRGSCNAKQQSRRFIIHYIFDEVEDNKGLRFCAIGKTLRQRKLIIQRVTVLYMHITNKHKFHYFQAGSRIM